MGFDHAVVVGAGIGGLLAAAALSARYGRVTIVERDELPSTAAHRRGVPQGEQMHSILAIGQAAAEDLLPGVAAALSDAGGLWYDSPHDTASLNALGWTARGPSEAWIYGIRRYVLEHVIREQVRALPNVEVVRGRAVGLLSTPDRRRVMGLTLKDALDDHITADLVVDSSGRTSHAAVWVAALGYEPPAEEELVSDITYSTVVIRLPEGALPEGLRGVLAPPTPENLYGAVLLPCDNGLHQIAALGQNNTTPPTDRDGYIDHLARANSPIIAEIARSAEFIGPPKPFKIRGTRRRRWEDMADRPEGFVVVGDAVLALNPIYGQGMSVAAVEALRMRDIVTSADGDRGLARRIQESFRPTIDFPFSTGVTNDARFEGSTAIGFTPPAAPATGVITALATEDWQIAVALRYAGHFFTLDPLRRPEVAQKMRAWASAGRAVRPFDPERVPPAFEGEPLPR